MQRMNLNKFLLVSSKYNTEENFKKIDQIKGIINELSYSLGKEVIEKIMKTHKDYEYGAKFLEFLDLHGKLGLKEINKKLNINNPRLVESWYREFPPRPIITLLNLYFEGYNKITKRDLAYLFGWGFGDGGLSSEFGYYFVCGKKHDLLKIKEYLIEQIPKIQVVIEENDGHSLITLHNGTKREIIGINSWILYIRDSSFCKLLYAFGLTKGRKVLQETRIPDWIMNGEKEVKKAFLNAIFEGELQQHKVQYNVKRNKTDICPISFGMNKVEEYRNNLIDFFNDIRKLLNEFDIKTTEIEAFKPSVIRKDNKKTYFTRFHISISASNTIAFSKVIEFPFNQDKKNAIAEAVKEAKVKISRMNLQVEKYKKAMKLHQEGCSIYEISKKLNIQWHTANNWLKTKKHIPFLLTQNVGVIYNDI